MTGTPTFTPLAEREHFVYRIFDAEGRLLYVGATSELEVRIQRHSRTHGHTSHLPTRALSDRMAFWVAEAHPNRRAALAAETAACMTERPELNTRKVPA